MASAINIQAVAEMPDIYTVQYMQGWARNFENVALQKQYAKRNCDS
jgi:hypothetical protein